MDEILVGILIFVGLVAASLGTLAIYEKLPSQYRQDDTNAVVRLLANLFVVMTSLVLGLMINSARNTLEFIDRNMHAYATELILLDRTLRHYGPEASDVRQHLIALVQRINTHTAEPTVTDNAASEELLYQIGDGLSALGPQDAVHTDLWQDARAHFQRVVEQRWILIEQSEGTFPRPLIVMLVAWLLLIFASFGFRAPRNAVVVTGFVASAALIAAAVCLILDMDVPFGGPIQVSTAPLERAIAQVQE